MYSIISIILIWIVGFIFSDFMYNFFLNSKVWPGIFTQNADICCCFPGLLYIFFFKNVTGNLNIPVVSGFIAHVFAFSAFDSITNSLKPILNMEIDFLDSTSDLLSP